MALVRAHTATYGPWYFSSDGGGRFDLKPPHGTCYASNDTEAALRERLGESFVAQRRVSAAVADGFAVTEIMIPPDMSPSALLSGKRAQNYGVIGELDSMDDYSIPQEWARAFHAESIPALRYRGRFSHTFGDACWALFGPAGPASHSTGAQFTGREACDAAEIRVMPAPPTSAALLRVVDPPTS